MESAERRWCFPDQLGPHFLDHPDQPVLLSPFTAGNRRMIQPLAGLRRLTDLDAVVEQQRRLGQAAP